MNTKTSIDWIAVLALLVAMIVWASSFIALKSAIGTMSPMIVMFSRMFVASLVFLVFIKSFLKLTFTKTDIKYMLLMVLFEPCLYFLFEVTALKYTSAGQAGMISSMFPIMTAISAGILLKEYISKKLIIGSALAVGGAIWLSLSTNSVEYASNPLLGNFLEFIAMGCATVYTISLKKLSAKFSPLFLTAIQAFAGTIFFLPFAFYEYQTEGLHVTTDGLFWIVYLGVIVTLGGYGLFNFAVSRIDASKASVYVNLIPVFTLLLAFVILGEKLSYIEIVASGVILVGLFISQVPTQKLKKIRFRRKK